MQEFLDDYRGLKQVATVMPGLVLGKDGETLYQGDQPIPWVLANAPARGVTYVHPGAYRGGKIAKPAVGGVLVAADAASRPVLEAGPGDTLYFEKPLASPLLLESLNIKASDRTGISTYDDGKAGTEYRIDLRRCEIDGGYDHASKKGRYAKWGLNLHRWAGFLDDCYVHDVGDEHGSYTHRPGALYVNRSRFERCGRCGFQVVSRDHEGGPSPARVTVTDTVFEDCGLADGGQNLTVQGVAEIVVRRSVMRVGMNREFVRAYMQTHEGDKARFGTGGFVNWNEYTGTNPNHNQPSDGVWFDDVSVEMGEDFVADGREYKIGNAPAVQVTNSKRFVVTGEVRIIAPGQWNPALVLEQGMPIDYSGLTAHQVVGKAKFVEVQRPAPKAAKAGAK